MKKYIWVFVILIAGVIVVSCNNSENRKGHTNSKDQNTDALVDKKTSSFDNQINGKTPVLVDFYADWCKPCQLQTPIIDDLKAEMGDKMIVIKVNVDIEAEIAEKYGIQSIPTLMIFKEGEILWKAVGVQQKEVLTEAINSAQ